MVNGRKNFINCDTKQLFFAGGEGSKAQIGLDVQAGSAILISYSAVKTVADGKSLLSFFENLKIGVLFLKAFL